MYKHKITFKMLRKWKWQIPEEHLAVQYNWCQGPLLGRGPAVEKHWSSRFTASPFAWFYNFLKHLVFHFLFHWALCSFADIHGSCGGGAHHSVVGWGTMLQAWRSRVRVPMRWIFFFDWPNPPNRTMALGSTQKWVSGIFLVGKGRPARKVDKPTAICEMIF
jgi:hypothetical protein